MDIDEIDYLITAVKYDRMDQLFEKVRTHEHMEDYAVGYPYPEEREAVLERLKEGKFYATLVSPEDDEFDYRVGKKVEAVEVEGQRFIRTDGEKVKRDYLEDVTIIKSEIP
ncbi:MAG: hypothetical protein ACOC1V_03670 [Candidatus Saliniplasma sp.]